jgi:hypothetical protein
MSLRIRRGTDAQRQGITFDLGEPVWTTDTQKLYVGDGITAGGNNILAQSAGAGMTWNATTQKFDVTGGGGITAIVQDTNPTLGGNLALSGYNITGAGNISITGTIGTNGSVNSSGLVVSGTSSLSLSSSNLNTIYINGITTGLNGGTPTAVFASSKGTLSSPAITGPGDQLFVFSFRGFITGSPNKSTVSTAFVSSWDSGATMTNSTPGGVFKIGVPNNNSGFNYVTFTGTTGVLNSPLTSTPVYSVAVKALPSASTVGAGARAFVSDAMVNTFGTPYTGSGTYAVPVYSDGTAWYIG